MSKKAVNYNYRDLPGNENRNENIYRWYKNLERGSPSTADLYLRRLVKFCTDTGTEPEALLEMDGEELRKIVLDYVTNLEGKSGTYASSYVKALKNWFRFHGQQFNVYVKIEGIHRTKVSEVEKVPSKDELRRALMVADVRVRVAISLVAFSGVRLEVLGNYRGTDGLRIGDIPELVLGPRVEITSTPAMVIVRSPLSKARHQYFTFLCEEGCEYLVDYLNARLRRGEKLTPASPVIPRRGGGFLTTKSVSSTIKNAIEIAGFTWRPYVFRHYFDTYMLMAEASRIIPEDYRVFWMGHKGDIEHQYTTNKNRLPETLIEDMRLKYEQAAEMFLETKVKVEEIVEPRQKVVRPEEIDSYLESGWEYVATLPDGRIVIRKGQPFK